MVYAHELQKELALILIKELHSYSIRYSPEDFIKEKFERLEEIGTELDRRGGFELMKAASDLLPYEYDTRLNQVWDGIGNWSA
jgi:hypothetical protein